MSTAPPSKKTIKLRRKLLTIIGLKPRLRILSYAWLRYKNALPVLNKSHALCLLLEWTKINSASSQLSPVTCLIVRTWMRLTPTRCVTVARLVIAPTLLLLVTPFPLQWAKRSKSQSTIGSFLATNSLTIRSMALEARKTLLHRNALRTRWLALNYCLIQLRRIVSDWTITRSIGMNLSQITPRTFLRQFLARESCPLAERLRISRDQQELKPLLSRIRDARKHLTWNKMQPLSGKW